MGSELATFRADDDPRLVRAALACRVCLSGDVEWRLELGDWDAEVDCMCRACGNRRVVFVTGLQALRLSVYEPFAA